MDLPEIAVGSEILRDFALATSREWLVTNGLGGYASGTLSGAHSRRYHGLVFAALRPPVARTLVLAKLDETAVLDGREHRLACNEFADGTIDPRGHERLVSFRLEGLVPTWRWALGDVLLDKRVFMEHERNATWVLYSHAGGDRALELGLLALCTHRDAHAHARGGGASPRVDPVGSGVRVSFGGQRPLRLLASGGRWSPVDAWHWGFRHRADGARGFDELEDLHASARLQARLGPGETLAVLATLEDDDLPLDAQAALSREHARERALLEAFPVPDAPWWIRRLVLAADQFIVRRDHADGTRGRTIVAGYPWFADWGRDAMIALPGLTLATGRPDVAREILRTHARLVDRGMLPNRFPDDGSAPEYNTADAALWLFEAVRQYHDAARDPALVAELYPVLRGVVAACVRGTRHGIGVDADGLLVAGEAGLQLTWMDAKVRGVVVTPRMGKPVELNALWHHALRVLEALASELRHAEDARAFADMAVRAADSFRRQYCRPGEDALFDVVDGPAGDDPALRPNQVLAASLHHSPLGLQAVQGVVRSAAPLLTPYGLRTLAPSDSAYRGRHAGGPSERDAAYHQGTAWGWLLGPWMTARARASGDAAAARAALDAIPFHLLDHGMGTVSEVFDGDPPHAPSGCIAQAWSVGEVLRAWVETRPRQEPIA